MATVATRTTHKTASLFLRRVYRGHMFTESLSGNGYTRHNMLQIIIIIIIIINIYIAEFLYVCVCFVSFPLPPYFCTRVYFVIGLWADHLARK
jgi:hypothetical protein